MKKQRFMYNLLNKVNLTKRSSNPRYDAVVNPIEAKSLIDLGACDSNHSLVEIQAKINCGNTKQFWFAFCAKKSSRLREELDKKFERIAKAKFNK